MTDTASGSRPEQPANQEAAAAGPDPENRPSGKSADPAATPDAPTERTTAARADSTTTDRAAIR